MRYAVIGSGRQGTAAAYDIALFGGAEEIRLLDASETAARTAAERVNRLTGQSRATFQQADARNGTDLSRALGGVHAALSAVPYFLNVTAAEAAVEAGCHFNDLGGNTDVVRKELALHERALSRGVSIVPDCGLAPGMGNSLAAYGIDLFERPSSVRIYCGGLPQVPRPPLGYKQVFSMEGLTNEYTGSAVVLRNGKRVEVEAFTGLEEVEVAELGRLEAFYTSGGTSTCPWTYEGRLDGYEYKTLRYPGHYSMIRPLIELKLLDREPLKVGDALVSPRDLVHAVLAPQIAFPGDSDLVILKVIVSGYLKGRAAQVEMSLLDHQDNATGFSAMERTTAFPAAIVTILQARGDVSPGARPLEVAIPGAAFVAELKKRGFKLEERWTG
jgi:lysine 6-dehydrogenase